MIYTYYFAPSFRCELAAEGFQFDSPQPRTVKLWSGLIHSEHKPYKYDTKEAPEQPITIRISRRLGKYTVVEGLKTNWLASLYALNLVCKQVHAETNAFLYKRTVFAFNAPKRINAFFTTVPQSNLNLVTKLNLLYSTYGNPNESHDRIWQAKHLSSWSHACKSASKNLSNLKILQISLHIHDCAPKFNLRVSWLRPLLQFRRLTRPRRESSASPLQSPSSPSSPSTPPQVTTLSQIDIDINVDIQTPWSKSPRNSFAGNLQLAKASAHLHELFAQAVALALRGAAEEEAMAAFTEAWEGKYSVWRHHLQFARTGW